MQDFSEEVSDSPERLGHAHSTIPQASENEKFVAKDNKDASHPESCKGDEHSVESLEGNVGFERFVIYYIALLIVNHTKTIYLLHFLRFVLFQFLLEVTNNMNMFGFILLGVLRRQLPLSQ